MGGRAMQSSNRHNRRRRWIGLASAAAPIAALITVAGAATPAAAITPPGLYAYANGTNSPANTTCPIDLTPSDGLGCSLTAALANPDTGNTIYLATPGSADSYLGNWTVTTDGVTIEALTPGNDQPILDGNNGSSSDCQTSSCAGPILTIATNDFVAINSVAFDDANNTATGDGGAIYNSAGASVTIQDSTFNDDRASADGGAIDNGDHAGGSGLLLVENSTFSGNTAGFEGGAIDNGDESGSGTLTVRNSTFSDNKATTFDGGAIDNGDSGGSGTMTVTGSTFAGNTAHASPQGFGDTISNAPVGSYGGSGTATVAGNLFDGACSQGATPWNDRGYNASTDNTCTNGHNGDKVSPNVADLSPLGDNGGPTHTRVPEADNPAIDLVPDNTTINPGSIKLCNRTDQRDVTGPPDAPCNAGSVDLVPITSTGSPSDGGPSGTSGSSTMSVTGSPNPSTYGQPSSFTATIGGGTPCGTVQWLVDGTPSGAPVQVSTGTSSTGGLTFTFSPPSPLGVGSHQVQATLTPCSGSPVSGSVTEVVSKAGTTLTVASSGGTATAKVTPVAPGAGTPTGTVTFTVDGQTQPAAPLSGGVASITLPTAHAATATADTTPAVSASYSGDDNFTGSSGTAATSVTNPTITTKVTSAHAKTKYGWYRSPVKITFTCAVGSSALSAACPSPVTLSSNGAAQSVTKTITAADGGTATAVVSPINIDRTKPIVKVGEVTSGHSYKHTKKLTCHASDKLSGVASCTIKKTRTVHGGTTTVHYTATAKDKAGNSTTKKGDYFISS